MFPIVIGLTGYGRGKDVIAQVLVEEYGYKRLGLADQTKAPPSQLDPLVRNVIGSNSRVNALEKAWHAMQEEANRVPNTVAPAVRLGNEANWVHDAGGKLIRVERPQFDKSVNPEHSSERMIGLLLADHRVANDGTIENLRLAVRAYMLGFE